jgi:hypothetical protein
MIKNKIRIGSIFAALLLMSVVFAPAVMAQSESTNATEISNSVLISNEDIKKTLENTNEISINMKVLKETDNEKVVSIKKDDGAIVYGIYWKDENNRNRINFALVDQDKLVSQKLVSSTNLNNSSAVATAIVAAKRGFWNGSYAETYGGVSGGIHIYLSQKDASHVAEVGSSAGNLIGTIVAGLVTKNAAAAASVGFLVATAISHVYWNEQNRNGSLDILIPYTSIAKKAIYQPANVKIGKRWYSV